VLDLGNSKIRKVDLQGRMTVLFKDSTGMSVGRGLWVNKTEDTIWYSCSSQLKKWTQSGGVEIFADGFNGLSNIVQDANGNIVATARNENLVYRLDQQGYKTVIAGTGATIGGGDMVPALKTAFYGVRGVWFLADNTYFLATHEGSQVWYVDTGGIAHLFLDGLAGDTYHSGDGENYQTPGLKVSEVRSVTVDYQGNVLVAENDCGYIRKVEKRKTGILNNCIMSKDISISVYVNKASGRVRAKMSLSRVGNISIKVINQRGQTVDAALINASEVRWRSRTLSTGVYYINVESKAFSVVQKCVILN
jgi:hypothetical protein